MPVAMSRYLTVDQVAERTGWRPATIRQKVWRREIPFYRLGRNIRFKEADIEQLLEGCFVPALER